ncbi:MAG: GLUG motif-containing protein [Sedimentisphaerales bacterium]
MFGTYRKVVGTPIGIILCLFSIVFAYSGGSGEPNDPYQIATVSDWQQLMNMPADWNKCFLQTSDVNLQGVALTPVGNPTNEFTGVFDGSGHIVRNAVINENKPGASYVGLFGSVGSDGEIRNLGVENVYSDGYGNIGGLAGGNNGNISTCYVTGIVNGVFNNGSLAGVNYGIITNCCSAGTVNGGLYPGGGGGLVGRNIGSISNCYSTAFVIGNQLIGGLAGLNYGTVAGCYATGTVAGDSCVGGLVGGNYGTQTITDSYATGKVTGNSYVGGLVGENSYAAIDGSYSIGQVVGSSYVGGLVGYSDNATATASFWDVNTSGQTSSAGGEGKSTTEMQDMNTFVNAGWDFSYTDGDEADWFIQIDEYPILTWQISPADIYTDGRNNFRDFAVFAQYWMREDCRVYNDYCDWADLNFDGSVDFDDLIVLMSYWLESGIYE